MPRYNPQKFKSLSETPLGDRLWRFLNSDEIVGRLIAFSEADRPAVHGIEEALLQEFGDAVCEDRVKQMIGHMVRQVMEQNGWVIDQQNVAVFSIPFIKATRYRRLDRCSYFVFRLSKDSRSLCLVKDRSVPLPASPEGGNWRYWTTLSSPLRASIVFGLLDLSVVDREIDRRGFFRLKHQRAVRPA